MKATYERKTKIYFDSKENREQAIDFLMKLKIPFTYVRAFPVIMVQPRLFRRHHLDLYLTGIVGCISTFKIRKQLIQP